MVGESGLFTPEDIAYVQEAGVRAVSIESSQRAYENKLKSSLSTVIDLLTLKTFKIIR